MKNCNFGTHGFQHSLNHPRHLSLYNDGHVTILAKKYTEESSRSSAQVAVPVSVE